MIALIGSTSESEPIQTMNKHLKVPLVYFDIHSSLCYYIMYFHECTFLDGSITVNLLPFPTSLSTYILPPCKEELNSCPFYEPLSVLYK